MRGGALCGCRRRRAKPRMRDRRQTGVLRPLTARLMSRADTQHATTTTVDATGPATIRSSRPQRPATTRTRQETSVQPRNHGPGLRITRAYRELQRSRSDSVVAVGEVPGLRRDARWGRKHEAENASVALRQRDRPRRRRSPDRSPPARLTGRCAGLRPGPRVRVGRAELLSASSAQTVRGAVSRAACGGIRR